VAVFWNTVYFHPVSFFFFFMVALCNRPDHYIFMLWFVLFFFFLLFFPRLISAVGDWMFTILWHMVWPVEPAALHAAAKKYYLLHRTGSTTGGVHILRSTPAESTDSVRREQSTLTVIQRSRRRSFSTSRGSARQSS